MSAWLTPVVPEVATKFDLAVQQQRAGRAAVAAELYRELISAEPEHAATWSNLGLAYRHLGELELAQQALLRALQLAQDSFEATHALGLLLEEKSELGAALALFRRAADLRPELPRVQLSLAQALLRIGQHEPAVGHFQCALALDTACLEACLGLATSLQHLRRFAGASKYARRALALAPECVAAHVRLGSTLAQQFSFDGALVALKRALELDPGSLEAGDWLGYCLRNLGRVSEAVVAYRHALLAARQGSRVDSDATAEPGSLTEVEARAQIHSSLLYTLGFDPATRPEQILAEARAWSHEHAQAAASRRSPHPHARSAERRLRVGYVSPDFREHCQALLLAPVFRHHDRVRFEVCCYSSVLHPDERTRWFQSHSELWRDVARLNDRALAQQIRDDCVDVLIDLTMHMANGRLLAFAEKPAPVQISWLAYPGTTGVDAIDYRLTDPWLDPPGAALPYVEQSLYLPDAFWCYDPLTAEPAVGPLPALRTGQLTLGCLNDVGKLNAGVVELWARVLRALPEAVLLLLAPSGTARAALQEGFERRGVARERVTFVDRVSRARYLAYYQRIDLALDCLPANGHTTSLDALWMGVPVVTLVGATVLGRAGLCQCQHLGLLDFVAHTADEFVQIAVRVSQDLERLSALRRELRSRLEASPLMDGPRFTRGLEAAYRLAWRRWCGAIA